MYAAVVVRMLEWSYLERKSETRNVIFQMCVLTFNGFYVRNITVNGTNSGVGTRFLRSTKESKYNSRLILAAGTTEIYFVVHSTVVRIYRTLRNASMDETSAPGNDANWRGGGGGASLTPISDNLQKFPV